MERIIMHKEKSDISRGVMVHLSIGLPLREKAVQF